MQDMLQGLIAELQGYIGAPSLGGFIALGLYGLCAILVLVGLLKGWGRGLYRQLVRSLTVGFSAVAAVMICRLATPKLLSLCEGRTLGGLLEKLHLSFLISGRGAFTSVAESMGGDGLAYLASVPLSVIVHPVLLLVSFMLISALMLFVHATVCHLFGWTSYCNNIFTRIGGCVVGTLQGAAVALLVAVCLVTPAGGVGTMAEEAPTESRVYTAYHAYFEATDTSTLAKLTRKCGGDFLMQKLDNRLKVDGKLVDVDTLSTSVGAILGYTERLQGANYKELDEEQVEALRSIVRYGTASPEAAAVLASLVRGAASTLPEYEKNLPFAEPFLTTLTDMIRAQATLSDEHTAEDISTVLEAYLVLMESGALRASEPSAVIDCLATKDGSGRSAALRAYTMLYENERTRALADAVLEYTLMTLVPEGEDAARDGLVDTLCSATAAVLSSTDTMSDDDRKLAVAMAMMQSFSSLGLQGQMENFLAMASYAVNVYGDVDATTLTDAQLCDCLLSFWSVSTAPLLP